MGRTLTRFCHRPLPTAGTILLLGLLIREAFSFWTGHPYDFEIWIRTGYVVAHGANPYTQPWPPVPGVSFGYTSQDLPSAAYLPFWPDLFGGTYLVWEHIGGQNRFFLYFLLKQGPIAGDIATAWLLYRFVLRETGDLRAAVGALAFWSFFPYDIVIGSIWGQLDPVTNALLLAVLLLAEARAATRSIAWGLGVFIKWITAIFLPFELFRQRGWRRLWPLVALPLAAALTVLAFVVAGWGFGGVVATSTSEAGGGGGGMNYARLFGLAVISNPLRPIPFLYTALNDLWIPACVLAGWVAARWVRTGSPGQELRALLLIMAAFLLVRWGLNEQYFLYPFALLVADVYTLHPQRRRFLYYLVGVASAFLLINNMFGIWFAAPADPQAFTIVQAFDLSPVGGQIRYDLLDILSVLVTVALAQLVWLLVRDDPNPKPWLFYLWPSRTSPPPPLGAAAAKN
ncbi:MAG: hypothetical protein L3J92_04835 [Thermoplasmata archaeon]|nr:hypothetical protein [Thermoplasmata archaeon]